MKRGASFVLRLGRTSSPTCAGTTSPSPQRDSRSTPPSRWCRCCWSPCGSPRWRSAAGDPQPRPGPRRHRRVPPRPRRRGPEADHRGDQAQVPALIAAVLIATLYGEGLTRALARLGGGGPGSPRCPVPRLDASSAGRPRPSDRTAARGGLRLLVGGGLVLAARLSQAIGSGGKATVLGVYLSFLVVWAGATVNVLLCYRVFGPFRPRLGPLLWGAAAAGSWIAGSALGFLFVLSLPTSLGSRSRAATPSAPRPCSSSGSTSATSP